MSSVSGSDSVFGHYIQQASSWEPLLSESSALFRAVVEDDAAHVEAEIGADAGRVNAFYVLLYWGSQPQGGQGKEEAPGEGSMKPAVTVKQRTLLMIAAFHGSMRVLSLLAVNGADPACVSPDGLTSYELAYAGNHPSTPTIVAYLRDAENSLQVLRGQVDVSKAPLAQLPPSGSFGMEAMGPHGEGVEMQQQHQQHYRGPVWGGPIGRQESGSDPYNPDALPYSTSELTKAEYATDEFRMYCFKVLRCCRRYAHDWRACPFAHPTENARRRDPRDYRYCSIACPNYKQGFCIRGDVCPYAHGVFECWLHPSRYRSQLCKDGNKCRRPVCFFAHSLQELRTPSPTWVPTAEIQDVACVPNGQLAPCSSAPQVSHGSSMHSGSLPHNQASTPMDPAISMHISPPPDVAPSPAVAPMHPHVPATLAPSKSAPAGTPVSSAQSPHAPATPEVVVGSRSQQASEGGAGVMAPRMSNAFARKHGLNPKDSPLVNLQKMAVAGHIPAGSAPTVKQAAGSQVVPILPPETAASMMKGTNRQKKLLKQTSQATIEALTLSMNGMSLSSSGSQGPDSERLAVGHPSQGGPANGAGLYPGGPLSAPPVVPTSGVAVPHVGHRPYTGNGYMVGSPAGPSGYVPMVAGSQPGAAPTMIGQPGAIGLHPSQ